MNRFEYRVYYTNDPRSPETGVSLRRFRKAFEMYAKSSGLEELILMTPRGQPNALNVKFETDHDVAEMEAALGNLVDENSLTYTRIVRGRDDALRS
jgi:hypothetical protein